MHAVTPDRWPDMVALFGERGASSGCWCMWFRVAPRVWSRDAGDGNRAAMQAIVAADEQPGLLAYRDGKPVGWMSVAPRRQFERIVGPAGMTADDGVWSVVCFYIDAAERGTGVGTTLLAAGIDHARRGGARVLEAYPLDRPNPTNADAYTGVVSMFSKAGFREAGRFDRWRAAPDAGTPHEKALVRPPGRPVMRLDL
ncbi:MAG TPA: GNAT family N-acetyltransferase [Candidatus Limnocylindrales bacterium]